MKVNCNVILNFNAFVYTAKKNSEALAFVEDTEGADGVSFIQFGKFMLSTPDGLIQLKEGDIIIKITDEKGHSILTLPENG